MHSKYKLFQSIQRQNEFTTNQIKTYYFHLFNTTKIFFLDCGYLNIREVSLLLTFRAGSTPVSIEKATIEVVKNL